METISVLPINFIVSQKKYIQTTADLLKCGSCRSEFLLSDIVPFIQHKTSSSCKISEQAYHHYPPHQQFNEYLANTINISSNNDNLVTASTSSPLITTPTTINTQTPTVSLPTTTANNSNNTSDLMCGTCPQKFSNARSLLEHAQYIHKINIFLNSTPSSTSSSTATTTTISTSEKNSQNHISSTSTTTSNIELQSKSSKPTNEIFIDFVPSDKHSDRASSMYNITVSSSNNNNSNSNEQSISKENSNDQANKTTTSIKTINMSPKKKLLSFSNYCSENTSTQNKSSVPTTSVNNNEVSTNPTSCIKTEKNDFTELNASNDIATSSNNNNNSVLISNHPSSSNDNSDCGNLCGDLNDNNQKIEKRKRKILNKPFYCEVCNAKFNQKIHLIKHSAKHTGIKPFKCTECSYSTVERSHLKVHIRIHTGEKPFKCTFCEYATAQSSTLKIHKKRHHNTNTESNIELSKDQPVYITASTSRSKSVISSTSTSANNLAHSTNSSNKSLIDTDDDNDDHYVITNATFNDSSNDVIEISNFSENSEIDNQQQKKFKKSNEDLDITQNSNNSDDNKLLGLANIALENESDLKKNC